MYICKKKCFILVYLLLILVVPTLSLQFFKNDYKIQEFNSNDSNLDLKLNQASNFTVTSSMHRIIWIEGILNLLLTANESGVITCELVDIYYGRFFTPINKIFTLTGNNESQNIKLVYHPFLTTFPGKYTLNLRITGLYSYTENFEIILGMGYIILILVIIIFGIGIIIILQKKSEGKSKIPTTAPTDEAKPSETVQVPGKKIQCPECKKTIDEGLAFCPECGIRIPEFLRYNPN